MELINGKVCRLCPCSEDLINIFDRHIKKKYNLKYMIFVTVGIEISEDDAVSSCICRRCRKMVLQMYPFKLNALAQNEVLQKLCTDVSGDDLKLSNTGETPKKKSSTNKTKDSLHSSIAKIYEVFPRVKLPKKCFKRDMSPYVHLDESDVTSYIKKKRLNMQDLIASPLSDNSFNGIPTKEASISHTVLNSTNLMESTSEESNKSPKIERVIDNSDKAKTPKSLNDETVDKSFPVLKFPIANISTESSVLPSDIPVPSQLFEPSTSAAQAVDQREQNPLPRRYSFVDSLEESTHSIKKSQKLLTCYLCSTVYNTINELRKHKNESHTTCQFCKMKFKTISIMKKHLLRYCKVKKIIELRPQVYLEKVELNADSRMKYLAAFQDVGLLQDLNTSTQNEKVDNEEILCVPQNLKEPEEVNKPTNNVEDHNTQNQVAVSDKEVLSEEAEPVITISDDETKETKDPLPETATPSCLVRPDIRLKDNDAILNTLRPVTKDFQLIGALLGLTKKPSIVEEKPTQTNIINVEKIKVHNEGVCEFTNLKNELKYYAIPIDVSFGPFQTSYQLLENNYNNSKKVKLWDKLPLIDDPPNSQQQRNPGGMNSAASYNVATSILNRASDGLQKNPNDAVIVSHTPASPKIKTGICLSRVTNSVYIRPTAHQLVAKSSTVVMDPNTKKTYTRTLVQPVEHLQKVPIAAEVSLLGQHTTMPLEHQNSIPSSDYSASTIFTKAAAKSYISELSSQAAAAPQGSAVATSTKTYPKLRVKQFWELR